MGWLATNDAGTATQRSTSVSASSIWAAAGRRVSGLSFREAEATPELFPEELASLPMPAVLAQHIDRRRATVPSSVVSDEESEVPVPASSSAPVAAALRLSLSQHKRLDFQEYVESAAGGGSSGGVGGRATGFVDLYDASQHQRGVRSASCEPQPPSAAHASSKRAVADVSPQRSAFNGAPTPPPARAAVRSPLGERAPNVILGSLQAKKQQQQQRAAFRSPRRTTRRASDAGSASLTSQSYHHHRHQPQGAHSQGLRDPRGCWERGSGDGCDGEPQRTRLCAGPAQQQQHHHMPAAEAAFAARSQRSRSASPAGSAPQPQQYVPLLCAASETFLPAAAAPPAPPLALRAPAPTGTSVWEGEDPVRALFAGLTQRMSDLETGHAEGRAAAASAADATATLAAELSATQNELRRVRRRQGALTGAVLRVHAEGAGRRLTAVYFRKLQGVLRERRKLALSAHFAASSPARVRGGHACEGSPLRRLGGEPAGYHPVRLPAPSLPPSVFCVRVEAARNAHLRGVASRYFSKLLSNVVYARVLATSYSPSGHRRGAEQQGQPASQKTLRSVAALAACSELRHVRQRWGVLVRHAAARRLVSEARAAFAEVLEDSVSSADGVVRTALQEATARAKEAAACQDASCAVHCREATHRLLATVEKRIACATEDEAANRGALLGYVTNRLALVERTLQGCSQTAQLGYTPVSRDVCRHAGA